MKRVIISAMLLVSMATYGQFEVDANLKTRFELRHGQSELFTKDAEPAAFVGQRLRLNTSFKKDWYQLYASAQEVFVWGDTPQTDKANAKNQLAFYEAWVKADMSPNWAVKLGRQVLSYDDQRILGGLDWALQGRFHDAALLQYQRGDWKADFGFAFNQEGAKNEGNQYEIQKAFSYKTMQYAHISKNWEGKKLSFLLMNNGFQNFSKTKDAQGKDIYNFEKGTFNRQTTGVYTAFPLSDLGIEASAYYQFGKASKDVDLSAYQFRVEGNYNFGTVRTALGFEMLSGQDKDSKKITAFTPLYGTNHKFNGFMDYFYVSNYANSKGLNDLYGKLNTKVGTQGSILFAPHIFFANTEVAQDKDSYLGTELDLVYSHNFAKEFNLQVGYSHMLPSKSMPIVKEGTTDATNNWFWVQLYIRPNLFSSNK